MRALCVMGDQEVNLTPLLPLLVTTGRLGALRWPERTIVYDV